MRHSNWRYSPTLKRGIGLTSLCLLTLLTACASQPQIQTVKLTPPPALLADCPVSPFTGTTNGDLLDYTLDLKDALAGCNSDKRLLREWAAGDATSGK